MLSALFAALQRDDGRDVDDDGSGEYEISRGDGQGTPEGAADALLVSAGVKCEAQVVRVTQRACENRHDNRAHRLDALGQ